MVSSMEGGGGGGAGAWCARDISLRAQKKFLSRVGGAASARALVLDEHAAKLLDQLLFLAATVSCRVSTLLLQLYVSCSPVPVGAPGARGEARGGEAGEARDQGGREAGRAAAARAALRGGRPRARRIPLQVTHGADGCRVVLRSGVLVRPGLLARRTSRLAPVPQVSGGASPVGQVCVPAGGRVRARVARGPARLHARRPARAGRAQAREDAAQGARPGPPIIQPAGNIRTVLPPRSCVPTRFGMIVRQ